MSLPVTADVPPGGDHDPGAGPHPAYRVVVREDG